MSLSADALSYAKKNHKKLISKIFDLNIYNPSSTPFTLFMAGSPGSGKTEFSKGFLKNFHKKDLTQKIIRLDTDELREMLPQYNGNNSDEVQRAATLLFDKAFSYIQKKKLSVIVDTTFASPRAIENVKRALGRGRKVGILYLYQDPIISWYHTKKRERMEGRRVPKEVFINAYFFARKNVNEVKQKFGEKIILDLFEKDKNNDFNKKAKFNIK
jgi:UDP-N-acetylglucosamine kinase